MADDRHDRPPEPGRVDDAAAFLNRALKKFGIKASNHIPHRVTDGYGLNDTIGTMAKEKGVTLLIAVDCGGRGYAVIDLPMRGVTIGSLPATMVPHFLETFALRAGVTLHVVASGRDDHHLAEASFKALARALRQACAADPSLRGQSASTK